MPPELDAVAMADAVERPTNFKVLLLRPTRMHKEGAAWARVTYVSGAGHLHQPRPRGRSCCCCLGDNGNDIILDAANEHNLVGGGVDGGSHWRRLRMVGNQGGPLLVHRLLGRDDGHDTRDDPFGEDDAGQRVTAHVVERQHAHGVLQGDAGVYEVAKACDSGQASDSRGTGRSAS